MLVGGVLQRNMKGILRSRTRLKRKRFGTAHSVRGGHPMAFAAHFFPGSAAALPGNPAEAHPRQGLCARGIAASMTIHSMRPVPHVALFIRRDGGRIADDLGREMWRRL